MAELNTASRTCSGENSSDCGSEICGQPAKILGDHHGHSPRAIEPARNCTCGKNWDLASHGIVTAPDSHGQAGSRNASANMAMATPGETRATVLPARAAPAIDVARSNPATLLSARPGSSFLRLIPSFCL